MPLSDWIPLTSSNLQAYRYDADAQELHVKFKGGGKDDAGVVWSYAGVPEDVAHGLRDAESAGRHFHSSIKGAYEAKRAEE